jgi:hypothetical protein
MFFAGGGTNSRGTDMCIALCPPGACASLGPKVDEHGPKRSLSVNMFFPLRGCRPWGVGNPIRRDSRARQCPEDRQAIVYPDLQRSRLVSFPAPDPKPWAVFFTCRQAVPPWWGTPRWREELRHASVWDWTWPRGYPKRRRLLAPAVPTDGQVPQLHGCATLRRAQDQSAVAHKRTRRNYFAQYFERQAFDFFQHTNSLIDPTISFLCLGGYKR